MVDGSGDCAGWDKGLRQVGDGGCFGMISRVFSNLQAIVRP